MATNKNDENMVSFTKVDGSKMRVPQSMMKTQAAKRKVTSAARGEPQNVRVSNASLKEAIAPVLAREDIVGDGRDEDRTPRGAWQSCPGDGESTEPKDAPPPPPDVQ